MGHLSEQYAASRGRRRRLVQRKTDADFAAPAGWILDDASHHADHRPSRTVKGWMNMAEGWRSRNRRYFASTLRVGDLLWRRTIASGANQVSTGNRIESAGN